MPEYDISDHEGDETWECEGCNRTFGLLDPKPQLEISEPVNPRMYPGKTYTALYCCMCCEDGRHNEFLRGSGAEDSRDHPSDADQVALSTANLHSKPTAMMLPHQFESDIYRARHDRSWLTALGAVLLVSGVTAIAEMMR